MLGSRADMKTDRIDFISSYCDRWCERCAYSSRCSAYASEIGIGMCGDVAHGIELAVGAPHPVDDEPQERPWAADVTNVEIRPEEQAEFDRQEMARDARIDATVLSDRAHAYAMQSDCWFTERCDALRRAADPVLAEALDVVLHDAMFITVKVHRALHGRDRHQHGDGIEDDPVQNDWNGSAKVALISLERSEAAWRVISEATLDDVAGTLGDAACDLHDLVLDEFSNAVEFVRPGFDEPWR